MPSDADQDRAPMSPMLPDTEARAAWASRLRGRLPRIALYAVALVLSVLGLRSLLAPAEAQVPINPAAVGEPAERAEVSGFAEGFARAYLTYDPQNPARRARVIAAYASPDLGEDAGLTPPRGARQEVRWATPTSARRVGPGSWRVTIAAETSSGATSHLEIPVTRGAGGRLAVSDLPALVGPPLLLREARPALLPIDDPELEGTARRVLANYLAGDGTNLVADLDQGAVVSLLVRPVRGAEVIRLGMSDPGVVSAEVAAPLGRGGRLRLRYELVVRHAGRWVVRSITRPETR